MRIFQLLFLLFLVNVCKGVPDSRAALLESIAYTKTGLSRGGTTCRTGEVRCSDCKTSEVCAGPWKGWVKSKCAHKEFCDPMRPDKGCQYGNNTCTEEDPPVDDDFICTSDGNHPIFEDRSQYRLCIGGDAYMLFCQNSLTYDQNIGGCTDNSTNYLNKVVYYYDSSHPCSDYKRRGLVPNPECRSSYVYCFPSYESSEKKYITFNCPPGEIFERSNNPYDDDFMGKCVPDCKEETSMPVQGNCRQYVSCVRRETDFRRVTMTCPGNTWYDPYRKRCGFRKPSDSC